MAPLSRILCTLLAAGLLAAGLPCRAADAPPIRIELLPEVTVDHETVLLGEVATISAQDPALQQKLAALPLGRAPLADQTVELGRDMLMRWIRNRLGIEAAQIAWAGPAMTKISPLTATVAGARIAEVAAAQLRTMLADSGLRGAVDLVQAPHDLTVPAGKLELKPRAQATLQAAGGPLGALLAKRQSVWVDIWVDDRFVRTAPVALEVTAYAPAYVALQDLAAGLVFDPDHPDAAQVAVREVEWTGRNGEPIKPTPIETAAALPPMPQIQLRHAVKAGQPLTHADAATAPLVRQGSFATLRSVSGPISLESRVEVLQDGAAGQTVKVKMPKGRSPILAQVTGPGQVEIRE